nr:hypothetical protein CFP56_24436 [Quercus suber]
MHEHTRPHSSYLCLINSNRNHRVLRTRSAVKIQQKPVAGICSGPALRRRSQWTVQKAHNAENALPSQRKPARLVATGMSLPWFLYTTLFID